MTEPKTNVSNDVVVTEGARAREDAAHRNALLRAMAHNKAVVFDALRAARITSVAVSFDGAGDRGQIEDVSAYKGKDRVEFPDAHVEIVRAVCGREEPEDGSRASLRDAVESLCYTVLERDEADWDGDDGAYGDFTFLVAERRIDLSFNARCMHVTTSHHEY